MRTLPDASRVAVWARRGTDRLPSIVNLFADGSYISLAVTGLVDGYTDKTATFDILKLNLLLISQFLLNLSYWNTYIYVTNKNIPK